MIILQGPRCPLCGAKLDYLPDWHGRPPCGGNTTWHEEGVAEIVITVENDDEI